jgi:hypothetical protein|tara:strand:- start:386 stop:964 length:579 start_codon:yes stop_codon:yes gene_type:complete
MRRFTKSEAKYLKRNEVDVIYEDKEIKVITPKTLRASMLYGFGTKWCIASDDLYSYWDWYDSKGKFFFIFLKGKQMDNKFYKVAAWRPYSQHLPIVRSHDRNIIDRYDWYENKMTKWVKEHYKWTGRENIKLTTDMEFYDSVDKVYIMPVDYDRDDSVYCNEEEHTWKIDWDIYMLMEDYAARFDTGDYYGN